MNLLHINFSDVFTGLVLVRCFWVALFLLVYRHAYATMYVDPEERKIFRQSDAQQRIALALLWIRNWCSSIFYFIGFILLWLIFHF